MQFKLVHIIEKTNENKAKLLQSSLLKLLFIYWIASIGKLSKTASFRRIQFIKKILS